MTGRRGTPRTGHQDRSPVHPRTHPRHSLISGQPNLLRERAPAHSDMAQTPHEENLPPSIVQFLPHKLGQSAATWWVGGDNNSAAPSCNSDSGLFSDRRRPKLNKPSSGSRFRVQTVPYNGFIHLGNLRFWTSAPRRSEAHTTLPRVLLSLGFPCVFSCTEKSSALT